MCGCTLDPASNLRRQDGRRSAAEEPVGGGGEEGDSGACFSGVVRVESVDLVTTVPVDRMSSSAGCLSPEYLLASLRSFSANDNELALSRSKSDRLCNGAVLLNVKSAVGDDVMAVDSMSFVGSIEVDDRMEERSGAVGFRGLVAGEARGERIFGMMTTSGSSVASAELISGVVAAPKRDGGWGDVGEGIVKVAVTAALAGSLSGRRSPSLGRIDVRLVGVGGALIVYEALI